MANRKLLHKSKLKEFETWLVEKGWSIEPVKGEYEVLRAKKPPNKPLIIFERLDSKEHYTVPNNHNNLVYAYIKDKK